MKVLLVLFTFHLSPVASPAQEDPEYRLEIGGGVGAVTYLGDFNGNLLQGVKPWAAVMAKYKMNPRSAVGLSIGYGRIKGSSDKISTWYPQERYQFGTKMIDVTLRYEYNFWPFGTGREYRGARRLVPFVALGLGAIYHGGPKKGFCGVFPLGVGIKYKIGDRLNLTAEWDGQFTTGDKLDGMTDPYGIKSSGIFKNTDCLSILQVGITYDLWAKCKTCNNDRY